MKQLIPTAVGVVLILLFWNIALWATLARLCSKAVIIVVVRAVISPKPLAVKESEANIPGGEF